MREKMALSGTADTCKGLCLPVFVSLTSMHNLCAYRTSQKMNNRHIQEDLSAQRCWVSCALWEKQCLSYVRWAAELNDPGLGSGVGWPLYLLNLTDPFLPCTKDSVSFPLYWCPLLHLGECPLRILILKELLQIRQNKTSHWDSRRRTHRLSSGLVCTEISNMRPGEFLSFS